jgi:chaperonin cofactor prefoldin
MKRPQIVNLELEDLRDALKQDDVKTELYIETLEKSNSTLESHLKYIQMEIAKCAETGALSEELFLSNNKTAMLLAK